MSELSDRPIFVTGCPKSGTSLAAGLLSKSPDVALDYDMFPSLRFMEYVNRVMQDPAVARETLADPLAARTRSLILDKKIEALNATYFAGLHSGYGQGKRWGSSTKEMFLWYKHRIEQWFPKVQFVFILRDPRDTFTSFKQATLYIEDTGLTSFLRVYAEFYHKALAYPHIPIIRYEDIVVDDRVLFQAVGLERPDDAHSGMREVLRGRAEHGPELSEGEVITSRVGRWRYELTLPVVDAIEREFRSLLETYYP